MIGDRIKEARQALGYSAEQVAAFLGVSPATVYRYENGDISKLPSKFIKPLAEYLCVTPAYLMGWSEENTVTESVQHQVDPEISIVSGMMENLPQETKEQIVAIVRALVTQQQNKKG